MSRDMELSVEKEPEVAVVTEADASVLLLDTPDNKGVDFLQLLHKQGIRFISERVNDKEELYKTLEKGKWDLLLVCDQVSSPVREETQVFMEQLGCDAAYVLLSTGEITIDLLTDAYQKGFLDVLSSHHPDYSLEVFVRAVERSRSNYRLSQLNQEKFDLRRHCEQLVSGTDDALAYLQDGIHVHSNDSYQNLLGYKSQDDLVFTPFIDVVTTESQEQIKQDLIDFQQKLRLNPDAEDLQINGLSLQGSGESQDALQVSAVFKAAVYDGEACIQVVLKADADEARKIDNSSSVEGHGYSLFLTHLENYITEAREADQLMGYLVNILAQGFEYYIAEKGFDSLDLKLKKLVNELRAVLQENDLFIRFSGKSFLVLLKGITNPELKENTTINAINALLDSFSESLNAELNKESSQEINFIVNLTPVDGKSESAESLIKLFLTDEAEAVKNAGVIQVKQTDNVIPFVDKSNEKNVVIEDEECSADISEKPAEEIYDSQSVVDEQSKAGAQETSINMSEHVSAAVSGDSKLQTVNVTDEQSGSSDYPVLNQEVLSAALAENTFSFFCETVISVSDIETEFYDVEIHLEDKLERISRNKIVSSSLAQKIDLLMLQQALSVIGDLYKQGLEYRILISFSSHSLTDKKLSESVQAEIKKHALPSGMLTLDFSIQDINQDVVASISLFEQLGDAGILLSISDVSDSSELQQLMPGSKISLVRLDSSVVEQAVSDENIFNVLNSNIEKLHENKIRVVAGNIKSNELLNICCKAKVDLVKGEYIQKSPLPLNEDSLAQEMLN